MKRSAQWGGYWLHSDHVHVESKLMIGNTYQDKAVEALPEPTHTYQSLEAELYHKGTGKLMGKRKVGNNTWLIRDDERVHVKLHQTYVLTYTADNRVILNSGGWETVTTKDRINAFLGWGSVSSHHSVWQVEARFWMQSDNWGRGYFIEALVPFESGMALNVRTHELVQHPDMKFIDIDTSLVMREASDLSRLLSVHSRMLETKIEEESLTKDDLHSALRLLDRYRDEQKAIKRRMESLESSQDWASTRLDDLVTQAMKAHAEFNLETNEKRSQIKGQERMRDLL